MKINVFSEIAPLKNVIIHSPIGEHHFLEQINTIERLNNKENPDFLLFDDLVETEFHGEKENQRHQKSTCEDFSHCHKSYFLDLQI